jgi:hypothetical protein
VDFIIIVAISLVILGVIAAVASYFQKGDDDAIQSGHDCASCAAVADGSCKIGCLIEEKKRLKDNKTEV